MAAENLSLRIPEKLSFCCSYKKEEITHPPQMYSSHLQV